MATRSSTGRTSEQHRADGRSGIEARISKMVDPDGSLKRADPDEYARSYRLMMNAQMLAMRDVQSKKRQARAAEAKTDPLRRAIKALRQAADELAAFADRQEE